MSRLLVTAVVLCLTSASPGRCAPIHDAAARGEASRIEKLLASNLELVNSKDERGRTPLHWAADKEQLQVARLLLTNRADVNAKDDRGVAPLHVAASLGRSAITQALVAAGADVSAKDQLGRTPLWLALNKGHKKLAEFLRSKGAIAPAPFDEIVFVREDNVTFARESDAVAYARAAGIPAGKHKGLWEIDQARKELSRRLGREPTEEEMRPIDRDRVHGIANLWVVSSDGTRERRLTSGPSHDFYPSWSDDRTRIAFMRWQCPEHAAKLCVADYPSGSVTTIASLINWPGTTVYNLSWLRSGQAIMYQDQGRTFVVDVTTKATREVSFSRSGRNSWMGSASLSPLGNRIAGADTRTLLVAPAGGGEILELASIPEHFYFTVCGWSPDGGRILAYVGRMPGESDRSMAIGLYSADASTGDLKCIAADFGCGSYSPDGRYIATARSQKWDLYMWSMDVSGGMRKQLTNRLAKKTQGTRSDEYPSWTSH